MVSTTSLEEMKLVYICMLCFILGSFNPEVV